MNLLFAIASYYVSTQIFQQGFGFYKFSISAHLRLNRQLLFENETNRHYGWMRAISFRSLRSSIAVSTLLYAMHDHKAIINRNAIVFYVFLWLMHNLNLPWAVPRSFQSLPSNTLQRYVVALDRPSLWNINSAFACFPDLISFDAIINCPRPREWLRVDTPAASRRAAPPGPARIYNFRS